MRASVLHGAKDLRLEQVPRPSPGPGMVLLRVRQVGICGSDMHYFEHGFCGAFVPSRPFILGHELTAEVVATATDDPANLARIEGKTFFQPVMEDSTSSLSANDATGWKPVIQDRQDAYPPAIGARVTVNPARACGFCDDCKAGRGNLCRKTIMLGSASTTPPTDGAFAEFVTVRADQCHVLPPHMSDGLGAMMEPFAVALHAVKQAGSVAGKRVLVTGGGPIGLLVLITARAFGATPVALSDVIAGRREAALKHGADFVLDPANKDLAEQVGELTGDGFDVIFEASGAPPALRQAFHLVRRGGTIVQIGTLGADDVPLPANHLMVNEIRFIGSFRYGNVFDEAIRLVETGRVNLEPLISEIFPLEKFPEAMQRAFAKDDVVKVQIQINQP